MARLLTAVSGSWNGNGQMQKKNGLDGLNATNGTWAAQCSPVVRLPAGPSLQNTVGDPGAHGDGDTGANANRVAGMGSW